MTTSPEEIEQQIQGSIKALEKLSAKEREKKPNAHFADNYNKLLELAKKALPDIADNRWPPNILKTNPTMGPNHAQANYVEILAYLNQIAAILGQNIEPTSDILRG